MLQQLMLCSSLIVRTKGFPIVGTSSSNSSDTSTTSSRSSSNSSSSSSSSGRHPSPTNYTIVKTRAQLDVEGGYGGEGRKKEGEARAKGARELHILTTMTTTSDRDVCRDVLRVVPSLSGGQMQWLLVTDVRQLMCLMSQMQLVAACFRLCSP